MARKVFISFLGTNEYQPVIYTTPAGDISKEPLVFVQEAAIIAHCKGWKQTDAVMIFRTDRSEARNWIDRPSTADPSVMREGLRSRLEKMRYKMATNPTEGCKEGYIIPPGFEEDEVWRIFEIVVDKIREGDEIYFDVTHAFRTIPMFATVLFNYCKYMKKSVVRGIYYGAFEKLGSLEMVKAIPPAERRVPLVDMTSLVTLQSTNLAASNFMNYGTLGTAGLQIQPTGDYEFDDAIDELNRGLGDLDFYLQTARLQSIYDGDYMAHIGNSMAELRKASLNRAQLNLLETIADRLEKYGFDVDGGYSNIEAAINWLIDYGMIQQAITLVREYIPYRLTYMVLEQDEYISEEDEYFSEEDVEDAKDIVNTALVRGKNYIKKDWKTNAECRNKALDLLNLPGWDVLKGAFNNLREIRNDLNHAAESESLSINDYVEKIRHDSKLALSKLYNIV